MKNGSYRLIPFLFPLVNCICTNFLLEHDKWLLNTLQSSHWGGLFTTALLAWYLHATLPQLQARSNHKHDCHRILVPKSQVESILQCFGLIFILMDRLGALLSTLGANLLKSVFLETPCTIYVFYHKCDKFYQVPQSLHTVSKFHNRSYDGPASRRRSLKYLSQEHMAVVCLWWPLHNQGEDIAKGKTDSGYWVHIATLPRIGHCNALAPFNGW